jgi:hypothetical protein
MNQQYADVHALEADEDAVNFTVPGLGIFNFSKLGYKIVNAVIFLLFLLLFGLEGVRGRLNARKVFVKSLVVLGSALGVLISGVLISYICSTAAGIKFKLMGTLQGIMYDNAAMIASIAVMTLLTALIYVLVRRKAVRSTSVSMRQSTPMTAARNHAYTVLYGTLALMFVLSVILLFALGENMMFLIPLAFATFAMVLYHLTNLKVWLPVGIALILLHAFSFYYALSMALTIGALGVVMMLVFLVVILIIPMADIYMMPNKKK